MEKAVENLEMMFKKAETDLNYFSRKLEFEEQIENPKGASAQTNPLRLMKKIGDIKSEYATLVQEISAIQQAQQETVQFFQTQLQSMIQMLGKLESQSGCTPEMAESTVNQLEELTQLLGIPKEDIKSSLSSSEASPDYLAAHKPGEAKPLSCEQSGPSSEIESSKSKQSTEDQSPSLSAYDIRAGSSECIDLTEDEFLSVSELVRGRVKIEDVNKTFRSLWQYFKEEKNTKPLTPKDMNIMGMRVTGATGQAKLKVLRALKLCQLNKNGDVTQLCS